MTVCVQTIVKTKLNVLCFITHFSAAQRRAQKRESLSLHATVIHTEWKKRNKHRKFSQFLHGAHQHRRTTQLGFSDAEEAKKVWARTSGILLLCRACELARQCSQALLSFQMPMNALLCIKCKHLGSFCSRIFSTVITKLSKQMLTSFVIFPMLTKDFHSAIPASNGIKEQ